MSKTHILFIGATGYVGGTVFSRFLDHPDRASFVYTVLVRSPDKAERLKGLGYNMNVVLGSTSDAYLLRGLAAEADVVIHMVDSDYFAPVETILSGLKTRHEKTGTVPRLIHTSSTAILCDNAMGMYASNIVHSDMNFAHINALPASTIHRNVDAPIVNADAEGYVKSYLIFPSFIFGLPSSKLTEAGIQNPDMTCVMWAKMALECGGPRFIGMGENLWGFVSNTDLAKLFLLLFDYITNNPDKAAHGREGYYFATGGEFTMREYMEIIGETMVKLGKAKSSMPQPFHEEELDRYFTPLHRQVMGGNSRGKADRSKSIGWEPTATREDVFNDIRVETEAFIKDGSRIASLTPAMIMTPSLVR